MLMECSLDHDRRIGEAALRIARREGLLRDQVRRQGFVDQRGAGRERALHRGDRRERLMVDHDQLGGVLGEITIARHDAHHRVADEAHLVDRQRGHLDRVQALDWWGHAQRRGPFSELPAGHDVHHARSLGGRRDIDRADARMGVRRPHEMRMQRAGKHDVIEIAALSGEEAMILPAQQRLANRRRAHSAVSGRRRAAAATAATIL
jgi:hypothetical protein